MKVNLLNKVLETDHRTYEVKKYIKFEDSRSDYYVSGFELLGCPDTGSIWTIGRWKGDKSRSSLYVGRLAVVRSELLVPSWYPEVLARRENKNRFCTTAGGYVVLPDRLRFEEPLTICMFAMRESDAGNVQKEKPVPATWAPYELPENFRVVEVG